MSLPKSSRDRYLRKKYGITQDEYEVLLNHNDGRCWACGKPPKEGRNLHVDHDHKTRKVRALLCWACNQTLRSYVTPRMLVGLQDVLVYGTKDVATLIGHSGECAPVRRKKKAKNG